MPTYGYRCPECGHDYEVFQKISDATPAKCPRCGAPGERVITGGAGILFKGSGFYITDYGRGGKKPEVEKPAGKKGSKKEPGAASDTAKSSKNKGAKS
jgi:putative FmdB family regulatory protein